MPVIQNIDKQAILNAVKLDDEFGTYAAQSWQKKVEPYIPYNTGRLCNDVTIKPFAIQYNAPYAEEVYNNSYMQFRKDKHPLATAHWNEVAAPVVMASFIQDMQSYMDRKVFNVR